MNSDTGWIMSSGSMAAPAGTVRSDGADPGAGGVRTGRDITNG